VAVPTVPSIVVLQARSCCANASHGGRRSAGGFGAGRSADAFVAARGADAFGAGGRRLAGRGFDRASTGMQTSVTVREDTPATVAAVAIRLCAAESGRNTACHRGSGVTVGTSPGGPEELAVPDSDDSTLWRISAFERQRTATGQSGFATLDSARVLPTTLTSELAQLDHKRRSTDAVEVVAACMRHHESALVLLRHRDLVWPLTLFPRRNLYHLPRSILESLAVGPRDLEVLAVEPPGLRPPGHPMHELIADGPGYRLLPPLLWAIALHAPRAVLVDDIGGRAAYRLAPDFGRDDPAPRGALAPALQRLRSEIASLAEIAHWPGMDRERAARLLNAVYLQGGLMVLRTHPAASDPAAQRLSDWFRVRR
jgi:hypothetical protein